MALYNTTNIDYTKRLLHNRVANAHPAISLFYESSTGIVLSINVSTTQISVTYQSTTKATAYSGKTVEELCADINQFGFPIKAKPLIGETLLETGDLISTNGFKAIPQAFSVYDLLPNNGVVIRTKRISIRHKSRFQISLQDPIDESPVLPWYPRVSVGSFSQTVNGRTFFFSIPEFANQTWSTTYGRPFKDVFGERPIFISKNTYRLRRTPIYWNGESITLFNGETPLSSKSIVDVDTTNGLVYLKDSVSYIDDLTVDYTYKEEAYEYKDININCHFKQNPLLIGKFVLMYMLPYEGTAYEPRKRTVYHSIGNTIPEAIDSIKIEDPSVPILIIGAYSIQQVQGSDRAKMLDTRVKGGGLKDIYGPTSPVYDHDSILEPKPDQVSIESVYKEAANFFDIASARWDGEIYPGAAAVIIDLPLEVSSVLPLEDIKQKATKFLSAGVYPLFDFSDRPLPDISGFSRQVSCFHSGSYHWGPTKYSLPDSLFTGSWDYEINKNPPISYVDGSYAITPNTETGAFQYYLKSTPTVGIEWLEREYTANSGSRDAPSVYTEWKKKRVYDTREVDNLQLVKGVINFDSASNGKQYKNVVVHSPARLDHTGEFVRNLHKVLEEITTVLSDRKIIFNDDDPSIGYIKYDLVDNDFNIELAGDYQGSSSSSDYLQILEAGNLSGNYNSVYDLIFSGVAQSIIPNGEYIKFFSTNLNTYIDIADSSTDIPLSDAINRMSAFAYRRKQVYGTGDSTFQAIRSSLTGLAAYIASNNGYSYWPYRWSYTNSVGYDPQEAILPEVSGFGYAEIQITEDYLMTEMFPAITSIARLLSDPTGSDSVSLANAFYKNHNYLITEANKFYDRIYDTPTLQGYEIVDTWYSRHDRLGRYAGNYMENLIEGYEYLKQAYPGIVNTGQYIHYTGLDLRSLDTYFTHIHSGLNVATGQLIPNLYRGGIVDRETIKLVKSYGWYVNNRQSHYAMYDTGTDNQGDEEIVYRSIADPDYRQSFSGIYNQGLDIILKSMVTTEGLMMETNYVNWNPGPFQAYTPYLIFDAMVPGIQMDRDTYIAKAMCVFNTLTGNYYYSGVFLDNPRLTDKYVGSEVDVSRSLAKLLVAING